ncbi:hypothetical protein Nepgr_032905 [Nepenthes gracilis]|uniref:Uncharacterized protein n=1 Tax=Nepenthes gracilis TaxID=150966 RepID=A0AAD3Y655_NEPGR|nr:hypothetical protein Nepgr_032905 [Nepenthes gracilis]
MRLGMPTSLLGRRQSAEEASSSGWPRRSLRAESDSLDFEDFNDVFGGPPRSVLSRMFSGVLSDSDYRYQEISWQPESPENRIRRRLTEFRIPSSRGLVQAGFYNDIFGSEDGERRSRSRSKSAAKSMQNPLPVLRSDELSPLRLAIGEDVNLSSFASNLRPISIPLGWDSSSMEAGRNHKKQGVAAAASLYGGNGFIEDEYLRRSNSKHQQRVPSPDTINLEEFSLRISMDDGHREVNSPHPAASMLCEETVAKASVHTAEEDKVASSYVVTENTSRQTEAEDIDEAIKWAKGKFNAWSSQLQFNLRQHISDQSAEMLGDLPFDSNTSK